MKKIFFAVVLISGLAQAATTHKPEHVELCIFDNGSDRVLAKHFQHRSLDVLKAKSLSDLALDAVNQYLSDLDFYKGPMTLKQIQEEYGPQGDQRSSDLVINFIT